MVLFEVWNISCWAFISSRVSMGHCLWLIGAASCGGLTQATVTPLPGTLMVSFYDVILPHQVAKGIGIMGSAVLTLQSNSFIFVKCWSSIIWVLDSNRRVGVWSLPWRWHILSIPLTTRRGAGAETCGLDDVFPPDDSRQEAPCWYIYIYIYAFFMGSVTGRFRFLWLTNCLALW